MRFVLWGNENDWIPGLYYRDESMLRFTCRISYRGNI
jgi:hypothetical protein